MTESYRKQLKSILKRMGRDAKVKIKELKVKYGIKRFVTAPALARD